MSRHRDVRNTNYDDEYEGYYDVYGHSVEDDYAISPSVEHFLYSRDRQHAQLSHFMTGGAIPEDQRESFSDTESDPLGDSTNAFTSKYGLSDENEARLRSCIDDIRNVVGDTIPESSLARAVLNNDYNVERSLDVVLCQQESKRPVTLDISTKPKKGPPMRDSLKVKVQPPSRDRSPAAGASASTSSITPALSAVSVSASKRQVTKGFDPVDDPPVPPVGNLSRRSSRTALQTENTDAGSRPVENGGKVDDVLGAAATFQPKSKQNVDIQAELLKREQGEKLLSLVVIGHVDAGKSTLMGHLLYKLGCVNKKTMHKYEQESKKLGKASFAYAWVLDETGEERTRGITMDVAQTKFETESKIFTLLDAPGHRDFIPNMITGAAQADVAVLVVDASTGEFEAGFDAGGQTREHAILVRSLGVSQLTVAINKLDTNNWSETRFREITNKLKQFLKQVGFKDSDVSYIPVSGLTGENVVESSQLTALTSWYTGPSLVKQLDLMQPPKRDIHMPLRLCISDIFKGMGSGFSVAGKIESGYVQISDKVLIMPKTEAASVKGITLHDEPVTFACAGDHVTLTLTGADMNNLGFGNVLCKHVDPVKVTNRVRAEIIIFNIDMPITKGFSVIFHFGTASEPAIIRKLIKIINKKTGEVLKRKPRCLLKQQHALVEVETARPVCVELFKEFRSLGRIMLRYGGRTIAAGVITEVG